MEFLRNRFLSSPIFLIKILFQTFCFAVLIYQTIDITKSFLNFEFEVKLKVNYEKTVKLPSISLCLKKNILILMNYEKKFIISNDSLDPFENEDYVEKLIQIEELINGSRLKNLKQLFDKTINFTKIAKCFANLNSMNSKDENFSDNCEIIGKVAEFFRKTPKLEKCFTFFNINLRNNRTNNYAADKYNFIEFEIVEENFDEFLFLNKNFSLYLSIHSPNSLFSSIYFHKVNVSLIHNCYSHYTFSKITVENLEWPYQTDCKSSISKNEIIYSYEGCLNSCILNRMLKRNICVSRLNDNRINLPLIKNAENIILENIFCQQNLNEINLMNKISLKCSRMCKRSCIKEYYKTDYSGGFCKSSKEDSRKISIQILSANIGIFEYQLSPKMTFINYASNLGGIISLWLGFAIIDFHNIFKILINYLIRIVQKMNLMFLLVRIDEIFQKFFKLHLIVTFIFINDFFKSFLRKMDKINFKILLQLVCIIFFVYQTIELTFEYLEYKTVFNVKWRDYFVNGSLVSLPAVSYCRPIHLESSDEGIQLYANKSLIPYYLKKNSDYFLNLFQNCKYFESKTYFNNSKSNYCELLPKFYNEILNNQTHVSDYLNLIDLNFDAISCFLSIPIKLKDCLSLTNSITSYTDTEKCYTFMSKMIDNININEKISHIGIDIINFRKISTKIGRKSVYIHDSNQLPSFPTSKLSSLSIYTSSLKLFTYEKIAFERLPHPYDTDCSYNEKSIKSRAQCLNEKVLDIIKKNKCSPKNHKLFTYFMKNGRFEVYNHTFCKDSKINFNAELNTKECRISCYEEIYEISRSKIFKIFTGLRFDPIDTKYMTILYSSQMTFISYLINIGGLLGLWYGISLADLKYWLKVIMNSLLIIITKKFNNFESYIRIPRKFLKYSCIKVTI
jgi:hypothetical protein